MTPRSKQHDPSAPPPAIEHDPVELAARPVVEPAPGVALCAGCNTFRPAETFADTDAGARCSVCRDEPDEHAIAADAEIAARPVAAPVDEDGTSDE